MRSLKKVVDPAKINQLEFSSDSCSRRTSDVGLALAPIGAIGSRKRVGVSSTVMVYNSGNSVAFVRFGDSSVAAAAGAADGIPVLSGEKCILNSGTAEYVIASSASVFAYSSSAE